MNKIYHMHCVYKIENNILTIGIVHLWSQVGLDKEAGETGSHVVFAISSGVVWQR